MERKSELYKPELFFGLVGPLGADLPGVVERLENELSIVGYRHEFVRLSQLISKYLTWPTQLPPPDPLDLYIEAHQNAGDKLRCESGNADSMALLAIAEIREIRKRITGDYIIPAYGTAYIISSLKHPHEYRRFLRIYGDAFFLIGINESRSKRVTYLSKKIAQSRGDSGKDEEYREVSESLIRRDYKDSDNELGQNVQETFPYSSLFVGSDCPDKLTRQISRFVRIIFGYQFHTPTKDEYLMYHAHAASLRSSDLSRQVGAAIGGDDGDILAVGTNEVPRPFGGLYWEEDSPDWRDFKRGEDTNYKLKVQNILELIKKLKENKWLKREFQKKDINELLAIAEPFLKNSGLMDISEYGRTVHAEMAALLNAANKGIKIGGSNLFTTTFPCHNCTKHIIASGIKRVVYIEPYPKSKADILHDDAVDIDESSYMDKVIFEPFVGVSPRSFIKSFAMQKRKGEKPGTIASWVPHESVPKILDKPESSYIPYEIDALEDIKKILDQWS